MLAHRGFRAGFARATTNASPPAEDGGTGQPEMLPPLAPSPVLARPAFDKGPGPRIPREKRPPASPCLQLQQEPLDFSLVGLKPQEGVKVLFSWV